MQKLISKLISRIGIKNTTGVKIGVKNATGVKIGVKIDVKIKT